MRALFVMDPLSTVNVHGDSSYVLMLEWQARGGEVWHCLPDDLFIADGEMNAQASRLQVGPRPRVADVLETAVIGSRSLEAVFQRKDPPFHMGYVFTTYMLDVAAQHSVVVNRPSGLRDANEKMLCFAFPDLTPDAVVTNRPDGVRKFVAEHGGIAIIKPWDGNGGRGIFVLREDDKNLNALIETSTADGREYAIVQEYLPAIAQGDKRIILVNGEPKGAFLRIPPKNDHRGNMHVGATVQPCDMSEVDRHICERLAPYLKANGLIFTGIDVIGDKLTEVNVTSPTGLQECHRLYGTSIEVDIVDAVLAARSASC